MALLLFAASQATAALGSPGTAHSRLFAQPRLESLLEAQRSSVVRIPQFLSTSEIERIHEAASETASIEGQQDIHKRQGAPEGTWSTVFFNHHLAALLPELHQRLLDTARTTDAAAWKLLDDERHSLNFRCVEYHVVSEGGGIPMPKHHDFGSLLTMDVMLSDPSSDFSGGTFCTLESDGRMQTHSFEQGDLLIFQSHKYHCVQPLSSGKRRVLVAEIWEGLPRRCSRRCNTPWGPCECKFAPPAPRYYLSASTDLRPCLSLMSKSEAELEQLCAELATDPTAAETWQAAGAHAQWKRRQALDHELAVARGWTKNPI